jgi:hypothetical protein
VNPQALPDLGDYVKKAATPAPVVGDALVFSGGGLWTPSPPRHKNFFINGGMRVAQRSTKNISDVNQFGSVDRWYMRLAGAGTVVTSGVMEQGSSPGESGYYLRGSNLTYQNGSMRVMQRIESANAVGMRNKRVTISGQIFQNWDGVGSYRWEFYIPVTNDNFSGPTHAYTTPVFSVPNSAWTKFSYSFDMPNCSNGLECILVETITNATVGGAIFGLTDVQLEIGPTATPFEFRPIAEDLALCQRYYEIGQHYHDGAVNATSGVKGARSFFKVTKRIPPDITKNDAALSIADDITTESFRSYDVSATVATQFTWKADAEL